MHPHVTNPPITGAEFLNAVSLTDTFEQDGTIYVSPVTDSGVAVFWRHLTGCSRDEALDTTIPLTALLEKDGEFIQVWAMDTPADINSAQPIMTALEMDDSALPVPPSNDWRLADLNLTARAKLEDFETVLTAEEPGPVDDLAPAPETIFSEYPEGSKYGDATVARGPYREADQKAPVWLSLGDGSDCTRWKPTESALGSAIAMFCQHNVGKKDGDAVMLGKLKGRGQRIKPNVECLYFIGLDLDLGTPAEVVKERLKKFPFLSLSYTSHSNGRTVSEFKTKKFKDWAARNGIGQEMIQAFLDWKPQNETDQNETYDETIRRLLRDLKWDESVVAAASYRGRGEGFVILVKHAPIHKCRVIVPLAAPFVIEDEGTDEQEVEAKFAKIIDALGSQILGLPYDPACKDVSRLFFLGRRPAEDSPYEVNLYAGPLFDYRTLQLDSALERYAAGLDKDKGGKSKSSTTEGKALGKWFNKRAHGFQIVKALRDHAPDHCGSESNRGVCVLCPFAHEHTDSTDNPNESGCWAADAGDVGEYFVLKCQHSCKERYTNLDMLGRLIKDKVLPKSVLTDEKYNAVILDDEPEAPATDPHPEPAHTESDIDAAIAALTEKSTAADRAPIVRQLVLGGFRGDALKEKLKAIVKATGCALGDLKDDVKALQKEQKKAKTDDISWGTYEYADPDELVAALNKKCAVVSRPGQTQIAIWDKKGVPNFMRKHDAAIELAPYKLKYLDDKNKLRVKPGIEQWLQSEDRRKFEKVTFAPNAKNLDPDVLNLWTGFAVKPKLGDWRKMHDHIRDNVCKGNKEHLAFLLALLAQMFQFPERKVGVAVVLRGEKGVGKSKLSEWLAHMVGERHAMTVDKSDQWNGRFNAHLEQVIFLGAEEALFAGDPQAKASVKHLITSRRMTYEKKGLDAYEGPNFTRVFITSNENWVIPAEPGERRFFVLDVDNARKQDGAYFKAIDEQMANGGAEAMLRYLTTLDISKVDFSKPPVTEALSEQIRVGMPPALKWLASVLSEGALPFKDADERTAVEWPRPKAEDDDAALQVPDSGQPVKAAGEPPRGVDMPKDAVVASYRQFVPGYHAPATPQEVGTFLAKHVPGLHDLVKTSKYIGATRYWRFPPLDELRAAFVKAHPGYIFPTQAAVVPDEEAEPEDKPESNVVKLDEWGKAKR